MGGMAWQGWAVKAGYRVRCWSRHGLARQPRLGAARMARIGQAQPGSLGLARIGMAWLGSRRLARNGPSKLGWERQSLLGSERPVVARYGEAVVAWPGTAHPVSARLGIARQLSLGPGSPVRSARQGTVRHGSLGVVRLVTARAARLPGSGSWPRKHCDQSHACASRFSAGHQDRLGRRIALGVHPELPRAGSGWRRSDTVGLD